MGTHLQSLKSNLQITNNNMAGLFLNTITRGVKTFGRSRVRSGYRFAHPLVCGDKAYIPNYIRFMVWMSFVFGMTGMTHFIHSGTNAKYSEIRNTEMYQLKKGCPIKEGYKNWEE